MKSDVRILVVDDNHHIRDLVMHMVASWEGFTAQGASDGAQGLEVVLSDPPDLILLDTPIILMTSHGSEAIAVELFRKGVRDYLIKPFGATELQVSVERALAEVRLRKEKEALTQHLVTANRQLRRRVRELDTLYRVGKSVTSLLSVDQLLERMLDAVFYVIGPEEATLLLADEETGQLRTELHRQRVPGEVRHVAHRSVEELAADAARKGDAADTLAMLAAPLKIGEQVIGVMVLGNRVSTRPFSGHDRQLLLALAGYAAIALENARLYEEVRRADRAKSEFVSFVAHELRTPMTSIRGYAELLAKETVGPLMPQQREFVSTIISNAERMQVLVSDLRDISRIELGQLNLEIQQVRLEEALESALEATRGQIEARSQRLTVNVPERLPPVHADPARLTQILINLLSNAYKYTPEGGSIHVGAWLQNGYVHCAVSDTGIGISPEDQKRLFTKFFRADDPAVREMPGTGLGLCIVKSLVELQGGEIEVESEPGKGTTFRFTLPSAAEA